MVSVSLTFYELKTNYLKLNCTNSAERGGLILTDCFWEYHLHFTHCWSHPDKPVAMTTMQGFCGYHGERLTSLIGFHSSLSNGSTQQDIYMFSTSKESWAKNSSLTGQMKSDSISFLILNHIFWRKFILSVIRSIMTFLMQLWHCLRCLYDTLI